MKPTARAASALRWPTANSGSLIEPLARRMRGDRAGGIGAGDDDAAPVGAQLGVDRLDPEQRRDQHLMTARAQRGRGALAVLLRAGDDDAH